MFSKRIEELGNFIPESHRIIDVGCDHGLLDIYLSYKYPNTSFLATDISANALANAKKNIAQNNLENRIQTKLTDGLNNIDLKASDLIVISGMGTNTIIKILKPYLELLNNIIIQSNRDLEKLRNFMFANGFDVKNEKAIYDDHYYVFIHFFKDDSKHDKIDSWLGPIIKNSEDSNYFSFLLNKYKKVSTKVPENDPRKNEIDSRIKILESLIEKK